MITIKIDNENGLAVPEGKIKGTIEMLVNRIQHSKDVPAVGQGELVAGLRLAVQQGKISPFAFMFLDRLVLIDKHGNPDSWPTGFPGDVLDGLLSELVGCQLQAFESKLPTEGRKLA